ncbi:MAG: hypothetical protein JO254_00165 [Pseudolabrys sp.]|nr:hypothetical protein [Pseudolabrys sp.]
MKSRPFLIAFFAVLILLTGLSIYLSMTVDRARVSVDAAVSPDGRYKATRTTTITGGSQHMCFEDIIVRLAVYPDDLQEKRNLYQVYAAPCAADGTPLGMKWLSNTDLQITHTANPSLTKDTDIGKTVHVTFVAR